MVKSNARIENQKKQTSISNFSAPSVSSRWLNMVKNRPKSILKRDWCKFIPLILIISTFGICGLTYALTDEMDTETNFFIMLLMMILGSILCVLLLFFMYTKCKKNNFCSKDVKVSRVFNQNNGDDYIDIDY